MSVSTADPRAIAGRMVGAINRRECGCCHRPFPRGGVLAFGLSGSDPRWYPTAEDADHDIVGVRYIWPLTSRQVTHADVIAWLDEQDDEMQQRIEHVEARRAERRARREISENDHGFRTSPWPCDDCGYPKRRPADRCDHCGDEPCSLYLNHTDYNHARGYRD